MTDSGGPSLPQERRLVTAVPGPRSAELMRRRDAVVARGIGTTLPVFVERAGGGVLVDVDGNSLIDFGSGIAVASVGNAAEAVVPRVQEQVARFTHTCFMVTPYAEYVEVCEALRPADSRRPREAVGPVQLRSRGRRERGEDRPGAHQAAGRRWSFDHGYHGRTNLTMALTAKNMPYKHSFGPFAPEVYRVPMSYPFRDPEGMTGEQAAARALDLVEKQVGADNVACVRHRADPGRGRVRRPARRVSCRRWPTWCTDNGAVFVADEIQSGFARTGDWFACDDEGVVPDLVTTAKGIAGRAAAGGGHRPGRASWTRRTSAGSAARTAATRSPARPRWARSRRWRARTCPPGPGRSAR